MGATTAIGSYITSGQLGYLRCPLVNAFQCSQYVYLLAHFGLLCIPLEHSHMFLPSQCNLTGVALVLGSVSKTSHALLQSNLFIMNPRHRIVTCTHVGVLSARVLIVYSSYLP